MSDTPSTSSVSIRRADSLIAFPQELRHDLRKVIRSVERPSFLIKIADMAGKPFEALLRRLPSVIMDRIGDVTNVALRGALMTALLTLRKEGPYKPREAKHRSWAMISGIIGGGGGLPGTLVELPLTTAIILRSIAEIARSHGEDLSDPETQLQCLQVLALGSPSAEDDAADSAYYAARIAMAQSISAAAKQIAKQGVAAEGSSLIVKLVAQISQRFGIAVSDKLAAQAVPMIGGVAGCFLNYVFLKHFQTVARGHFQIRRWEREFGKVSVQQAFADESERLRAAGKLARPKQVQPRLPSPDSLTDEQLEATAIAGHGSPTGS